MNQTACPSLADLLDERRRPELKAHLDSCVRCRTLLERLPSAGEPADDSGLVLAGAGTASALRPPSEGGFGLGTVAAMATRGSDEALLCAIVEIRNGEAIVVPLSHEVRYATNWDLLLEHALLGYDSMLEVWNHGTVLLEQLEGPMGALSRVRLDQLEQMYAAALAGGEPPATTPVGPPVLTEADPRLLFQEEEFERAREHWIPASLLAEASSLGGLIELRIEALEISDEQLEADLSQVAPPVASWLESLRTGTLDIYATVPIRAMCQLLQLLRVPRSQRALSLIRDSVYDTRAEGPATAGRALARRRRGAPAARRAPTDHERSEAADAYRDALAKEWLE